MALQAPKLPAELPTLKPIGIGHGGLRGPRALRGMVPGLRARVPARVTPPIRREGEGRTDAPSAGRTRPTPAPVIVFAPRQAEPRESREGLHLRHRNRDTSTLTDETVSKQEALDVVLGRDSQGRFVTHGMLADDREDLRTYVRSHALEYIRGVRQAGREAAKAMLARRATQIKEERAQAQAIRRGRQAAATPQGQAQRAASRQAVAQAAGSTITDPDAQRRYDAAYTAWQQRKPPYDAATMDVDDYHGTPAYQAWLASKPKESDYQ